MKNPFSDSLETVYEGNKTWNVEKPFSYIDPRCSALSISVPSNFKTDFASIPPLARLAALVLLLFIPLSFLFWPFWAIVYFAIFVCYVADDFNDDNELDQIATVHDVGYSQQIYPRRVYDRILLTGCLYSLRNKKRYKQLFIAYSVYVFVRIGGGFAWKSDQIKYGIKKG